MKYSRLFIGAFVLLFLSGCHDDNNSVSGPPARAATGWTVGVTSESITGDPCAIVGLRASFVPTAGAPWDVIRSGRSIVLRYLPGNYPTDHSDYTGTLNGRSFTASRAESHSPGNWSCANGQIVRDPIQTERVSGAFASDDRSFDAVEIETWRLPSGEEGTVRRQWVGTRL
jgi:hypothetical protein